MEYTLIPTQQLNRLMKVLDRLEPLVGVQEIEWITQEEARKILNCSDQTLRRLRQAGKIHYTTLGKGRGIMIDKESVRGFSHNNSTKQ